MFSFQISFSQNIKKDLKSKSALTVTLKKQVLNFNSSSQNNYPKPSYLESEPTFNEAIAQWEKMANKSYRKAITNNIKKRLIFLEKKSDSYDQGKIDILKNIINKKNYINNDSLAVKAYFSISHLEQDYFNKKLVDAQELLIHNYIKLPAKVSSPNDVHAVILYIRGRIYENGGISWYMDGASPGSGNARYTDMAVKNDGTKDATFYLKMDTNTKNGNMPTGWDMFWLDDQGHKIHESPHFNLPVGFTITLTNQFQSYTQSPDYEVKEVWPYYDLMQDISFWPDKWISGKNKFTKNDVTTPYSRINGLSQSQPSTTFNVSWSGDDPGVGHSGIKNWDVQYRVNDGTWHDWITNTASTSASFTGSPGNTYYFQCRAIDNVGHIENYPGGDGDTHTYIKYPTNVHDNAFSSISKSYNLKQNYPNPFNPTTTIKYEIPKSSYVTLRIYNISGQLVATLVNQQKIAGSYSVTWNAKNVGSGIYLYRITAGSFSKEKKCIVLK